EGAIAGAGTDRNSSHIIIASDDPDVYDNEEVKSAGAIKTQNRFWLTAAWGGGFFQELFWSLGKHDRERLPSVEGSPKPSRRPAGGAQGSSTKPQHAGVRKQEHTPAEAMQLREAVARMYLLDLAILGQAD